MTNNNQEVKTAFERAVESGRLIFSQDNVINDGTQNFVANYMYMGNRNGKDLFKNIKTREYLK